MTKRTLDDRFQLLWGLLQKLRRLAATPSVPAAKVAALAAFYAARDLEVIAFHLDGDDWGEVVRVLRMRQDRKRRAHTPHGQRRAR